MSIEHAIDKSGGSHALRVGHTIGPVAESEGVSTATIRRWVREGKFPRPVKRGGTKGKCVWYDEVLQKHRAAHFANVGEV